MMNKPLLYPLSTSRIWDLGCRFASEIRNRRSEIVSPLSILLLLGTFFTQNVTAQTYCASKGTAPWTEWIATVQIGSLTNNSQKEGYGNFTSQSTDLAKGANYTFNITKGYSWAADPALATQQGRVWIDYNRNGLFEDTEIVASFTRNTNTATITIPTTASVGTARMRVSLKTIGAPTACETFDKGEVEDYTVNITGSTGTGQPDLTFSNIVTPTTARLNENLNFSFRFKNIGTGTASSPFDSYGYVLLVQNGVTVGTLLYIDQFAVPAGFDTLITYNSIVPLFIPAGNYTLRFVADLNNRITESNENNNVFDFPFTLLPATTDNSKLKITAVTGPTLANPSTNLPLSITIKNEGTTPSFPDSVFYATWRRVFFVGGSYPSNYALNRVGVPAIAAGATVTVNANFILPPTLRTTVVNNFKHIEPYVMLKSRENIANSSTPLYRDSFEKISFSYPIQPLAATDLALTGTQLNTTWDSINPNVELSLTVRNNGTATAENVTVNVNRTDVVNSITYFNGTALDNWVQLTGVGQLSNVFTDVNAGREENGILYSLWKIPQLAAGASVTATFRGKATGYVGVPQGITYYYKDLTARPYIIYADARDNNRANDSLSTFTFRNILYVENRPIPDLILTNLTIPTPSVQQGQNLNFNVDLKNVGAGAATGSFTVKSYLSVDQYLSDDDYQNGSIPTANYAAGQAVLQVAGAMNVTSSVAAGTYFLLVKIDADNQITETNENNNVVVSGRTVTVTAPVQNGTYCVSKGNLPWNEWISGVQFANLNNTSQKEGYGNFTSLTANVSQSVRYTLNITQGFSWAADPSNQTQQWSAWIDYNKNNVFEVAELIASGNRNTTTANVLIPSNATVGVTRMRISMKTIGAPTVCETFDRGEVEDYNVNITGGSATQCPQLSCRDTTIVVATNVTSASVNLPSLSTLTGNGINCAVVYEEYNNINNPLVDLPLVVSLPLGLSTITHSVGYIDQITLSRSVGRCDIRVTILQQTNNNQPDLTLNNLRVASYLQTQGQNFIVNIDAKNIGTAAATGNFTIKAYLSRDKIIDASDYLSGTVSTSNYPTGANNLQIPITMNPTAVPIGNYYVVVKIDADNQITESDETNNVLADNSTVYISNDGGNCTLTSTASNVQCSDNGTPNVASDDTYTFSVTVNGSSSCASTQWVSGAATGNFGAAATFGPYPISGGSKTLVFAESLYQTATTTVTVNPPATCSTGGGGNQPDLTITNLTVPTPSVQQGQVLSFKADLKNIGTAAASGNFTVKSYLSTDNVLSANDYQDGVVPTGNYAVGFTVTQVPAAMTVRNTVAAGQYYLILKIDADNQVTESNEVNNVIVSTGLITVTGTTGGGGSDLALSLTSTPSVYRQYTTQNFRITATNSGTTAFSNVKIKFTRPALTSSGGTKVASIGTFQDFCPGGIECSEWTIPTLAGGATATLDAPIFILAPTGAITATATLLSSTPTDNTTANNTASVTVNSAAAPITQPIVVFKSTQLIPIVIQKLNPTLAEGEITLELESLIEKTIDFGISNAMGQTVLMQQIPIEKGMNRVGFDVSQLPQGLYFIQTNVGKGRNVPTKFIKM